MFAIRDSRHEDLQLFWLSFKHFEGPLFQLLCYWHCFPRIVQFQQRRVNTDLWVIPVWTFSAIPFSHLSGFKLMAFLLSIQRTQAAALSQPSRPQADLWPWTWISQWHNTIPAKASMCWQICYIPWQIEPLMLKQMVNSLSSERYCYTFEYVILKMLFSNILSISC